jgi:small subunit ribosomal protein S17
MSKTTDKLHGNSEQRAGVRRQEVVGEVISDKMDKTITVQIFRRVRHEKYGKFMKKTSVYKAHDEKNQAKKGDKVLIQMTRPLSKTKRWRLLEVLEKAEQDIGGVDV